MWRAGSECRRPSSPSLARKGEAGFTLMEMLVVMVIVAMAAMTVTAVYRTPSGSAEVKAAALMVASRLRDLRAAAMTSGGERTAEIDAGSRVLRFGDGRAPLRLKPGFEIAVVAADSEARSPTTAGIRFYPNGSSSGATINLKSERQIYEIRVNWLTGRVSAKAQP